MCADTAVREASPLRQPRDLDRSEAKRLFTGDAAKGARERGASVRERKTEIQPGTARAP